MVSKNCLTVRGRAGGGNIVRVKNKNNKREGEDLEKKLKVNGP